MYSYKLSIIVFLALVVLNVMAAPIPHKNNNIDVTFLNKNVDEIENLNDIVLNAEIKNDGTFIYEDDEEEKPHNPKSTPSIKPTATTTTSTSTSTTTTTTTSTKSTPKSSPKSDDNSSDDDDNSSSSSSSSGSNSGRMTFYTVGMGSCGQTNSDTELVVALNHIDMANGSNPNKNPKCGKKINIFHGGKTVQATIVDTCPVCDKGAIDVSPAVFSKFADFDVGVLTASWDYA